MSKKRFFVTVDTEGDALWANPSQITTENVLWIPAFQDICECYGLTPIYLTAHEMILDERFVRFARDKVRKGLCEVGLHVHARNNPPLYALANEQPGGAYLVEYPVDIIRAKIEYLKQEIEDRIEEPVVSHRAGRWNLNRVYIDTLVECGVKFDCSVTPGVDWLKCPGITRGSAGADYSAAGREPCPLRASSRDKNAVLMEYPMTIVTRSDLIPPDTLDPKAVARAFVRYFRRDPVWLRPHIGNTREMRYAIDTRLREGASCVEFMLHSSELMPGGSPAFPDQASIELLYCQLNAIFSYAAGKGLVGGYFEDIEGKDAG